MTRKIAFQGVLGAYSHLAAARLFPEDVVVPCVTFQDAFCAVEDGSADYAVMPVENSTAGRVGGCHQLFPHTRLHVVGEFYLPIAHCLLAQPGSKLEDIDHVYSHEQALAQCSQTLRGLGMVPVTFADTAGAARMVAQEERMGCGALASELAAETYGLEVLRRDMQDTDHNTTRFVVLAREAEIPDVMVPCKTTFLFQVRSIPAALYKALGGFATNGINLTKLESYVEGKAFESARFYAEIEGHIDQPAVQLAFEELRFFSDSVRILGTYAKGERG